MYDKQVTKCNTINTSAFVLEKQYNTEKPGLENKTFDTNKKILATKGLVKKTNYNAKMTEI